MDPQTIIASIGDVLGAFLDSPAGLAIKALVVGTLVNLVLGVAAAKRDGTYDSRFLDTFVRTTVWGRVAPVFAVTLGAYLSGDPTFVGLAVVAAGAVGWGMLRAALDSISQFTKPVAESAAVNALPGATQ
jgi:hypothetical protein